MYTYPDINDNLTGELISKVSVNILTIVGLGLSALGILISWITSF